MTTTNRPQSPSPDELALSMIPVVLGSSSLRRPSGGRHSRLRRPAGRVATGSPSLRPSETERLVTTPR
ncbi:hypothetical protein [Ornithinimicrobium flavum]|uniref:hypothetical protein n=1 Tax=Ornithinimicrobium flavum TaxID=1288636 RepID=UPI00106FC132|nr:hypothetical protein [Ornithinimicrobium flavum]